MPNPSTTVVRDHIRQFVTEKYLRQAVSALYQSYPTMHAITTLMEAQTTENGDNGSVPDGKMVMPNILSGVRAKINTDGNPELHVPVMAEKASAGLKWMSDRDTLPAAGDNTASDNRVSAVFKRAWLAKNCIVPSPTWDFHMKAGAAQMSVMALADPAIAETTQAVSAMQDAAAKALLLGTGADAVTGSLFRSRPASIIDACSATNTYGGLDRSTTLTAAGDNYWAGKYVSTNVSPSLAGLYNNAVYTQELGNWGSTPDLCILGDTLFEKFEAEAMRLQQGPVSSNETYMNLCSKLQGFVYRNCLFIREPLLTGSLASYGHASITDASKVAIFLTTQDWVFWAPKLYEMTDIKKLDDPGQQDARSWYVNLEVALICTRPWRQALYIDVS